MRPIILIIALMVTGCSISPKPVVTPPPKPRLAAPSLTTMAPCWLPVKLQKGPATQKQVEIAWGVDDDHLSDCAARQKILANYIRKRDAELTGTP